ncbi:MAG: carbohydrate binding family 9 domain-containing protein, partial [Prolixibacteraceae bacterium]|nr:carbohydrate binding family 9 domain-containing protein [Prolixibacteraceae bacterium]
MIKPKLIFVVVFISLPFFTLGQESISVLKNNEKVNFDGVPDEPFWELSQKFDLVMHAPNTGEIPSEKSTILISYNDNFLWVSAILDYKEPTDIVSTSKKRDEESKNPDSFGILLDSYNDNENALAFFTTPEGQRIDFTVSNDAQMVPSIYGSSNINYSWNTFWDVKTIRTESGWSVEMRIPFSSLRFQVVNDKVEMGLLINRSVSHCNEIDTYPEIDPRHGMLAPFKPSLAQTIILRGIKESKPVYVSPYMITGIDRLNEENNEGTGFNYSEDKTLTGGLDIKYSLTSNLTMDVSFNTDFAQVEADDEMVNLTRYALFYPEKRMFFQERSSIFDFSLGGPSQLFYSRRIGIDDDGIPVPIYGGARLTGRLGKWDMGFMDMQTRKKDGLPSENFGVMRFRRQVFNANSYVGAIMTSRINPDNVNRYSYGIDGIFRVFGDDYMQFNIAQTTDVQG